MFEKGRWQMAEGKREEHRVEDRWDLFSYFSTAVGSKGLITPPYCSLLHKSLLPWSLFHVHKSPLAWSLLPL
jgi:hypothetical protein